MRSYRRNLLTALTCVMHLSIVLGGPMFEQLGRITYRRRRLVLAIAVLFLLFAGAWGTGVFGKLISGNMFTPPGSQSQQEANLAARDFGRGDADVVVLYRSATMTVDN